MSDTNNQTLAGRNVRTELAGQAMAGLLSNAELTRAMATVAQSEGKKTMAGLAALAVYAADALISELNK
jgi:hypothetical protein